MDKAQVHTEAKQKLISQMVHIEVSLKDTKQEYDPMLAHIQLVTLQRALKQQGTIKVKVGKRYAKTYCKVSYKGVEPYNQH